MLPELRAVAIVVAVVGFVVLILGMWYAAFRVAVDFDSEMDRLDGGPIESDQSMASTMQRHLLKQISASRWEPVQILR